MRRRDWVETDGVVEQVYVDGGEEGHISVVFLYTVDGHYYSGTYSPLAGAPGAGEKITVRYDPDDPNKNDLVARDKVYHWIFVVIFAFVVIGIIAARLN